MTDVAFMVEEDILLHRKASALREERIKRLELKALYEEILAAERPDVERYGSDAFRFRG